MSTPSEGAKPRQARVTRAPAGPLVGERAQLALAGMARVVVVVPTVPAVERVVEAAVGWVVETDDGVEEAEAAVRSAARELQPVTARAATKTAVAMIRTGRMVTPPTTTTLWAQDTSLGSAGHSMATDGRRGHREPASVRSRFSFQPSKPPTPCPWPAVSSGRRRGQALTSQRPRLEPRAPITR